MNKDVEFVLKVVAIMVAVKIAKGALPASVGNLLPG